MDTEERKVPVRKIEKLQRKPVQKKEVKAASEVKSKEAKAASEVKNKEVKAASEVKNKEVKSSLQKKKKTSTRPNAVAPAVEILKKVGKCLANWCYEAADAIGNYRMRKQMERKRQSRMKRKLSPAEYEKFMKAEKAQAKAADRKLFIAVGRLAGIVLLIILLFFGLVKGIGGLFRAEPTSVPVPETETETREVFPEQDITIGATGSMLLHSPFLTSYPDAEGNYDFASIYKFITPYYSEPDFMTCEFEGALGGKEMGYSGYPNFITPDVIVDNMRDSGIDLQMLASNHIYDGWTNAFHRTMQVYEEKKTAYTGIRQNVSDKPYYIANINGVPVGYIDYVYETPGEGTNLNGMTLVQGDGELVNSFDYDNLDAFYAEMQTNLDRMRADGARFLVANMHWGLEYHLTESEDQRAIAQKLCDMGIDALIGGHPHCEQPIDVFQSGNHSMFCIFSVGNALSNQRTYLMDEMPTGHTEDGVMVTLSLHQGTDGTVSIQDVDILPTWVYRYQDNGSKYYIFPLDDVEHLEEKTGVAGIKEEAKASYERTMAELGPGLEKAKAVFKTTVTKQEAAETETE